jgi:DNA damage-inducible protein 1
VPKQQAASNNPAASASGSDGASASSSNTSASRNILANAQPPPATAPVYSEETIQNLIALGFDRKDVIDALQQAGGNPELAAALLFQ